LFRSYPRKICGATAAAVADGSRHAAGLGPLKTQHVTVATSGTDSEPYFAQVCFMEHFDQSIQRAATKAQKGDMKIIKLTSFNNITFQFCGFKSGSLTSQHRQVSLDMRGSVRPRR